MIAVRADRIQEAAGDSEWDQTISPRRVCVIEQTQVRLPPYRFGMKVSDLTRKQLSSVRCPTCGAAVGERCVLNAGGPRFEPHPDRKLSAAETVEKRRLQKRASN